MTAPTPQRRVIVRALVRSLFIATAVVAAYFVAPFSGRVTTGRLIVLVVGLTAVLVLVAFGARSIRRSPTPRARAIEVLFTVVPLFLVSFASAYYAMQVQNHAAFSQGMTRLDSLYFTVTVFATVGFGDISPVSQAARIVVMIQMIGDFALIGVGVRILVGAVEAGLQGRGGPAEDRRAPEDLIASARDAAEEQN